MNECTLPDIQETNPKYEIPIRQVGVQNVEVPFRLEAKHGGFHQLVANVSMGTDLDSCVKGISMSRLIRTLKDYLELPLKHKLIKDILKQLQANVGGKKSFMKFEFRLPVNRESLVTKEMFPIYYKCRFEGQLKDLTYDEKTSKEFQQVDGSPSPNQEFRFFQGVIVQYASYCPCSAELCKALDGIAGFPHNQRSFANVLIETEPNSYVWLEDIIEAVEERIKTLPYPIIKREDEQEIARIAARNPMFVEDAVRAISQSLHERRYMGIKDWIVKCVHEESIHTSEAIAINWKGIPNGFDGRRFI